MNAEKAVYAMLNASSAIAGMVGTRIYLDTRPEADPLPAIVYELISDKQDNTLTGEQELATARIQVNCLGNIADDLVTLREYVRVACHNQSGVFNGVNVVSSIRSGSGPDSYDQLVNIYVKSIDFMIRYYV